MSRIFLALALFAICLLLANLIFGLTVGDFGAASRQFQAAFHAHETIASSATSHDELEQATRARVAAAKLLDQQRTRFWPHIWLGIIASLVTLLVNSISITYFIGTNRWSCEVVDAFSLDKDLAARSRRLKRRAFPWSLLAIVLVLTIAGLGAASDPATLNPDAADFVEFHWGLAMFGLVVIAVCMFKQAAVIGENYALINEILAAAETERQRRKQLRPTSHLPDAMTTSPPAHVDECSADENSADENSADE